MIDREKFLSSIKITIKAHPELLNDAIRACTDGINEALLKARKQAMDMETLAVAMHSTMHKRYKNSTHKWINELVKNKVTPHLNDSYTAALETILEKEAT